MYLLDTTLREGELFTVFPLWLKKSIARELVGAGLKRIEVTLDYPPRTEREDLLQLIETVHRNGGEVILHGRACIDDIERILSYDVDGCAIYIAVSKLHREYKLHGIDFEDAIERLCECASIARARGIKYVRATLEDASRMYLDDSDYAVKCISDATARLANNGATIVSLPDTSGLLSPRITNKFISDMKRASILPLAAHFHNDYGMASANAIEAAIEGADEIHVSIMGIGDRNGISDLYEVAAVLEDQYGINTGVNRSRLRELYDLFSRLSGLEIPWRHPLSTEARRIRAGVHQSMSVKRKEGYIPLAKLEHDFESPLYEINQYIGKGLIETILAPYGVNSEYCRIIAERLGAEANLAGSSIKPSRLREVIREVTGIDVSISDIERYFSEKAYLLIKLKPQYPANKIINEIRHHSLVDFVDEVYGDCDMIIRTRLTNSQDNLISLIKGKFSDAIQELKILPTD